MLPGAAKCLEHLARAVGFVGRQYEVSGPFPVTREDIGEALGLDGADLTRLGALLYQVGRLWAGGSWANDRSTFSVTPAEDAAFFRDVESFAGFQEARDQLDRNDRIVTEAISEDYRRARGEPLAPAATDQATQYRLIDPALDALFQRDLAELADVHALGAWKASAILAGSCLETVLLDVCQQRDSECAQKWGSTWRRSASASDMARFAATRKWISQDHGDASKVLRRWRNTVHPYVALQALEPTKELADALTALLRLLLADLRR